MADSAESLIDRRRLRRKLSFWRVLAVLALALVVVAVALTWRAGRDGSFDQIARVSIEGMILEDRKMLELLDDLRKDAAVKAVILRIDSPGGTTVGGETLFKAAREIASVKPVAAEVGTLAASAGYMVAAAADHIVAHNTSIVGSIGVIFQYVDASRLLSQIGVDVNAVKSAPLKAEPSPFAPASEAAREMIRRLVMSTFDWFVELVAERRPLSVEEVRVLADGSIFSGEQSLANNLIDAIGGEDEVRAWLENERGVPKNLRIVDREPEDDDGFGLSIFSSACAFVFASLGLDPRATSLGDAFRRGAGHLDGLVSLWQPVRSGRPGQ